MLLVLVLNGLPRQQYTLRIQSAATFDELQAFASFVVINTTAIFYRATMTVPGLHFVRWYACIDPDT